MLTEKKNYFNEVVCRYENNNHSLCFFFIYFFLFKRINFWFLWTINYYLYREVRGRKRVLGFDCGRLLMMDTVIIEAQIIFLKKKKL